MNGFDDLERQLFDRVAHRADRSAVGNGLDAPRRTGRAATRGRASRRLLASAGVSLAAVLATVLLALGAASSPPPAFAVTRSGPGEVTITLRQINQVNALNARLASLGTRIRVVPVVHGCVAPVHTVSNGAVVPGPAKTLEAAPLGGPGSALVSMTISVDTIPGRTLVVAESKSGLRQVSVVVVDPAPACVGDTPASANRPALLFAHR